KDGDALLDALRAVAAGSKDANERDDAYRALGSFREPALLARALPAALSGREGATLLRQALEDDVTRPQALAWMGENIDALAAAHPAEQHAMWMSWAAGACTAGERVRFVALFEARSAKAEAGPQKYREALDEIDLCLAMRYARQAPFNTFLAGLAK
ncbi:MAG: hypothetical protein IT518_04555, partial [Burkholderiales bacterium]|nr:hypothetical protein [Burkholderiales bacterium]